MADNKTIIVRENFVIQDDGKKGEKPNYQLHKYSTRGEKGTIGEIIKDDKNANGGLGAYVKDGKSDGKPITINTGDALDVTGTDVNLIDLTKGESRGTRPKVVIENNTGHDVQVVGDFVAGPLKKDKDGKEKGAFVVRSSAVEFFGFTAPASFKGEIADSSGKIEVLEEKDRDGKATGNKLVSYYQYNPDYKGGAGQKLLKKTLTLTPESKIDIVDDKGKQLLSLRGSDSVDVLKQKMGKLKQETANTIAVEVNDFYKAVKDYQTAQANKATKEELDKLNAAGLVIKNKLEEMGINGLLPLPPKTAAQYATGTVKENTNPKIAAYDERPIDFGGGVAIPPDKGPPVPGVAPKKDGAVNVDLVKEALPSIRKMIAEAAPMKPVGANMALVNGFKTNLTKLETAANDVINAKAADKAKAIEAFNAQLDIVEKAMGGTKAGDYGTMNGLGPGAKGNLNDVKKQLEAVKKALGQKVGALDQGQGTDKAATAVPDIKTLVQPKDWLTLVVEAVVDKTGAQSLPTKTAGKTPTPD